MNLVKVPYLSMPAESDFGKTDEITWTWLLIVVVERLRDDGNLPAFG